jgi:hypothetical protein
MFVRFRERKSDGRAPSGTDDAKLACVGGCADRRGQRLGGGMRAGKGCPMKPRCRWLIAGKLVPYRLLVALIENRRVNGKVKQEQIADLGSIDGYMLPGFYPDGPPVDEQWHRASVEARRQFWRVLLDDVLPRLANRISAEDRDKIVTSIWKRIPMPTGDDGRASDLYDWKHIASSWQELNRQTNESIKTYVQMRDKINREIAGLRRDADRETANLAKAQAAVLKRSARR